MVHKDDVEYGQRILGEFCEKIHDLCKKYLSKDKLGQVCPGINEVQWEAIAERVTLETIEHIEKILNIEQLWVDLKIRWTPT